MTAADWKAQWITPDLPEDSTTSNPSPMLRRTFTLDAPIASARLYVTSLGLNEVEINGQRVGDHLFAPGWTSYDTRLQYETLDVTKLLVRGTNAMGAILGDGWYRGRLGWMGERNTYGELASAWQLVDDGLRVTVRIPPNSRATVWLPGARLAGVSEGKRAVASAAGVTHAAQVGDAVVVEVGSGDYTFAYDAPALAAYVRRAPAR